MIKIAQTHGYTVKDLRRLEKKTPSARMRLRLMAVRLVWEGYPAASAADIIGMAGETVSTYVAAWNAGGPDALVPHHSPWQPTKISPEVAAEVRSALETSPAAVGYGVSANWDSRGLQAFLRHRYGITMSRGGLRKWLHREGFSWTRPTYVVVKADPARQEALRQAPATGQVVITEADKPPLIRSKSS